MKNSEKSIIHILIRFEKIRYQQITDCQYLETKPSPAHLYASTAVVIAAALQVSLSDCYIVSNLHALRSILLILQYEELLHMSLCNFGLN